MTFSSVGLIPILLALLSLLFFVVLLSYNTLKRTRKALEESLEEYLQAIQEKAQITIKLANIIQDKGDYIHNYDLILKLCSTIQGLEVAITEKMRAEKQLHREIGIVYELIRIVGELSKDANIQELNRKLQEKEEYCQNLYRKYVYNCKHYHNFVCRIPSKWVAQVAGFRKFSLQ